MAGQQMIEVLKKQAAEIKELKETHRKRRPIVIEFSGSPKAGKTSCINSLKQFLKRNGFEVETINERASVCPVSDKRSPMFNIWTACMSLSGLIGIIEDKKSICDVIILDRGIFDALCWFEWLTVHGKMEPELRKRCQKFLLSNELVGMIDIVFSFTVEPEKSIEREYAELLTDQTGSIMNLKVLGEYRQAIKSTITSKSKYFGSVISIETSNDTQKMIGSKVTSETLKALKELLDEKVGYFEADNSLRKTLREQKVGNVDIIKDRLLNMQFEKRQLVESQINFLQPIPILVLTNMENNQILVVKKKVESVSKNSTEKDKMLLYVGGHTRKEDVLKGKRSDYLQTCKDTLQREVKEELGISIALNDISPIFIYGTGENEGHHIAICFKRSIETEGLKFRLDPHELVQTTGQTASGRFWKLKDIVKRKDELEPWSVSILRYYYNIEVVPSHQMSLFEGMEVEC